MLDSNLVNLPSNGSSHQLDHNARQTPVQILFETFVSTNKGAPLRAILAYGGV